MLRTEVRNTEAQRTLRLSLANTAALGFKSENRLCVLRDSAFQFFPEVYP
jgi:hypothetical protein